MIRIALSVFLCPRTPCAGFAILADSRVFVLRSLPRVLSTRTLKPSPSEAVDGPCAGSSLINDARRAAILMQAGLSPTEALKAATRAPAEAFRLADCGRIVAGVRADLVLVDGHPLTDIKGNARHRAGFRSWPGRTCLASAVRCRGG